jgi:catechol 2,3-dioxygenase-like lactoylglutathione lyase family enzyme
MATTAQDEPARLTHIGIVVPDLERAMEEMTRFLGLRWTPPQERPDGERTLRVAFSLSTPRIELIQGNPGGVWDTAGGPRIDHLAFWIPDFEATDARATELDIETEAAGRASWGGRWAYVRSPATGARIELCDSKGREHFHRQWGFTDEEGR